MSGGGGGGDWSVLPERRLFVSCVIEGNNSVKRHRQGTDKALQRKSGTGRVGEALWSSLLWVVRPL